MKIIKEGIIEKLPNSGTRITGFHVDCEGGSVSLEDFVMLALGEPEKSRHGINVQIIVEENQNNDE